jgi:hypothetical protein
MLGLEYYHDQTLSGLWTLCWSVDNIVLVDVIMQESVCCGLVPCCCAYFTVEIHWKRSQIKKANKKRSDPSTTTYLLLTRQNRYRGELTSTAICIVQHTHQLSWPISVLKYCLPVPPPIASTSSVAVGWAISGFLGMRSTAH